MEPKMIEIVTDSKSIAQAMVDAAMKQEEEMVISSNAR
ncbi:hypothetical protein [Arabidopsis thaliana]|uniref:Uncharacterized protein F4M19_50 n=1 Tax=Arabidopsis thaliana TaxID=3702 RepID=Q9LX61_ARATH|nr:hypothetical protein [Arabidopsis thaliana]